MLNNLKNIKHSHIKTVLLATLFLPVFTSCVKGVMKPDLPAKTQDGRNTLGFMANGKVWVNGGDICNWFTCEDNVVTGRLHKYPDRSQGVIIEAQYNDKRKNIHQTITINANNIIGTGTYPLVDKNESMYLITDWSKNIFYVKTKDSHAKLVITRLDTLNHIISGEFSGRLYNYHDSTTAIDISDGRFDTRLTYSNF